MKLNPDALRFVNRREQRSLFPTDRSLTSEENSDANTY